MQAATAVLLVIPPDAMGKPQLLPVKSSLGYLRLAKAVHSISVNDDIGTKSWTMLMGNNTHTCNERAVKLLMELLGMAPTVVYGWVAVVGRQANGSRCPTPLAVMEAAARCGIL